MRTFRLTMRLVLKVTPKNIQARAWEEVRVGYDSDEPTFQVYDQVYDRNAGRVTSSHNVSFTGYNPDKAATEHARVV